MPHAEVMVLNLGSKVEGLKFAFLKVVNFSGSRVGTLNPHPLGV